MALPEQRAAREGSGAEGRPVPDARRDRSVLRRQEQVPGGPEELVSEEYLRAVPADPMTRSADTWQMIPAEPDPSNPSAEIGIYNVKSGSDATGDRRVEVLRLVARVDQLTVTTSCASAFGSVRRNRPHFDQLLSRSSRSCARSCWSRCFASCRRRASIHTAALSRLRAAPSRVRGKHDDLAPSAGVESDAVRLTAMGPAATRR